MAVLAVIISVAASQLGPVRIYCPPPPPPRGKRPELGSLIRRYTVVMYVTLYSCTLCTAFIVSASLEAKVTTSANTRRLHTCSIQCAEQLLSVRRLELCPSGELPPVCLYFSSLSVVMWLWNPLPEIPGNPRASWDITKLSLFLCLCLFHWRLHYVSLSAFCRPGSSAAPSPWEFKVILFSGWLTHIRAFEMPEFLTFNSCANSRPQTI